MNSSLNVHIATSKDAIELIHLWKLCFTEDENFLNFYFREGFPLTETYLLRSDNQLCAALSYFPILYKAKGTYYPASYLYGVCTHPAYRNQGYSKLLFQETLPLRQAKQDHFILTRPATPSLFSFYQEQGFSCPLYQHQTIIQPHRKSFHVEHIPDFAWEPLSVERLLKEQEKATSPRICWEKKYLNYLLKFYQQSNAILVEQGENYCIAIPDPEKEQQLLLLESYFTTTDLLRQFCGERRAKICSPAEGDQDDICFALALPLQQEPDLWTFFSTPME